jgi:hypothetical protein
MNPKPKKCRNPKCDEKFVPKYSSLQVYCSVECQKEDYKPNLKLKSPTPIKKVSDKRKIQDLQYKVLRIEFLGKPENKICPITKWPATEIHHTYSGKDRAKYYLDTTTWIAVSREGHMWIHEFSKEARELGYLK